MEATIYIEIPVTVTFSVDPGQKQTHTDPGFMPSIEDIDYDGKQVLDAVGAEIFGEKSHIEEELMEIAVDAKRADEEDQAEMKYNEMKDAHYET